MPSLHALFGFIITSYLYSESLPPVYISPTHTNMKCLTLASLLVSALGIVQATPVARQTKTPYFLLIGDSTVAVDGGWGNGLLSYLKDPAQGENRGVGGKTTVSWKDSGRWEDLIESIGANKDDYEPIITIQFGHNDQKVMELDEFQANLESIAADVAAAGGTPVYTTVASHH